MKILDQSTVTTATPVRPSRRRRSLSRIFYIALGKRLFDLLLVALLAPLIVPIIAVLWVMARLDGGPGFYSQMRIGMDGKLFRCWKLRTMSVNAEDLLVELCRKDPAIAEEWHRNQKLENDPRITTVGRFARATSLDELPQIWNVLTGDMSFVGPRPFMTSQESMYRAAGGKAYFKMRPGVTGAWQVDGRGSTTFVERVQYDNAYFKALSLKEDLRCIGKTVAVVLRREGQ
ncbi:Undecaprenyl phosphate N,N'-diacetylbacillosamine 1-phosphate transferase [Pseudooceanicola marinus]|uniref:Undecaprenyl phosphate N,N'-diacetylbacillosamine 1-phosphate transferase n=1 Tax=Pseudooceanicola marinus TaxID=396013 RepID=A0A1X7AAU7_9RHOB|nr:sugar transferase [Pseudooceanicola marinus]SLN74395.1 Undecaprenyl phosphate N,N'-diacetylbacillosamine 1-phosphate transferase [Pseudooceanicola marinus]